MKFIKIISVCSCLLLFACKQQEQSAGQQQISDSTQKSQSAAAPIPTKLDKVSMVHNVRNYIDSIKGILPGLSPRQADMLYKATRHFVEDQLTLLKGEGHLMEWYYDLSNPATQPDSIRHELKLYQSVGLEAWDIGEGYLELRTVPDFYVRIFDKYVSSDYASFMKVACAEDSVLYQADAGLIIPFSAIAQRLLNWEQFIKDFPASDLKGEAKEKYIAYLNGYLLGEDNTPTFEGSVLQEEPAATYKAIAAAYSDTFTGALSAQFLERFHSGSSTSEERQAFIAETEAELKTK
jgi:hypothetical protein